MTKEISYLHVSRDDHRHILVGFLVEIEKKTAGKEVGASEFMQLALDQVDASFAFWGEIIGQTEDEQ